jgi:hypothetical protein
MHRPALWLLAAAFLALSSPAVAQSDHAPPSPPAASAEIDQTLINLPTTLELKSHKSHFRLTYRGTAGEMYLGFNLSRKF